MKLIHNLEIMRDSFRIAHPMLIHQQGQNDEAIEAVRAMEEALRKIAAIENKEYGPDWEEIEEARDIASQALRRAGGEG